MSKQLYAKLLGPQRNQENHYWLFAFGKWQREEVRKKR
jgi:hypothetical protein